jgi:iduronate 2-sulfatase
MGAAYVISWVLIVIHMLARVDSQLKPTNFIYIMYDDLRPELSIYGRDHMITPNFERLAAKSVVFDNAYAQISVCNPSRDSLLTGLRPDTVGTYSFQSSFRPHLIMPTRFAKAGYNTAGYGKIAHWEANDKDVWSFDQWDGEWYV